MFERIKAFPRVRPGPRMAVLALLCIAPPPAAAAPVDVLNPTRERSATNPVGSAAQTSMLVGPYRTPAVVMVTADGRSTYRGPPDTSGIVVEIRETRGSGRPVVRAHDDSLEGESSNIIYRAATSYNFYLPRGEMREIAATTTGYGTASAANRNTSVRLTVIALDSR